MSVLNKTPYLQTVLSQLTSDQLTTLLGLINGSSNFTYRSMVDSDNLLTEDDVLTAVSLKLDDSMQPVPGWFLGNCFIQFFPNRPDIQLCKIDLENNSYEFINEPATATDLRQIIGDLLGGGEVKASNIDSENATSGQVLTANGEGGATWADASGSGLPEATKSGQVIVSNNELEAEWDDAAPLAENLTPVPINNDTLYTKGPTGGLADISTGQEAYLKEIKGYTIVWNQLSDGTNNVQLNSSHVYITVWVESGSSDYGICYLKQNSSQSMDARYNKVYDLTLMFGGNSNIPFSLTEYQEYPANGNLPAQTCKPEDSFLRLFANTDLAQCPYDAGSFKNVKTTKLVETGQNLWNADDSDMVDNGICLLAGYKYEIYLQGNSKIIKTSSNRTNWSSSNLTRVQKSDGSYIWYITTQYKRNMYVKSNNTTNVIKFIGFVHSGNYCLTTGTNTSSSYANTNETIPAFSKQEFNISGIDGLNGIPDSSDNHCSIYDTKDYTRVGKIDDLSSLTWTAGTGTFSATITGIKPSTTHLLATKYLQSEMSVDENGVLTITASASPTGSLLYELATPVATGQDAFEPIALKTEDGWSVNDMGLEYFVQPANANCPVNQLSYYIVNLKDKLVNLSVPEIKAIDYNYKSQGIGGISINGNEYRIVPLGYLGATYSNSLAIGSGSYADSSGCVAIGDQAKARYAGCIAIGDRANAGTNTQTICIGERAGLNSTNYSTTNYCINIGEFAISYKAKGIAIGVYSENSIEKGVSFDGASNDYRRTIQSYSPEYVFFRFEDVARTKDTYAKYTSGHYLKEYIQNNTLTQETGTNKFYLEWTDSSNYKTITKNVASGTATTIDKKINGMHITVRLANNAIVGFDLLPFVSDSAYICYGVCDSNGTVMSAYLDSDGIVIIANVPGSTSVAEVKYYLR